jgi:hypothetical protein
MVVLASLDKTRRGFAPREVRESEEAFGGRFSRRRQILVADGPRIGAIRQLFQCLLVKDQPL